MLIIIKFDLTFSNWKHKMEKIQIYERKVEEKGSFRMRNIRWR